MSFFGPAVIAEAGMGRASDQAYTKLASMLLEEDWTLLGENTVTRPGWHAYVWQCPADNLMGDLFQVIIYRPVETCMLNSRVQGLELEAVSEVEIGTLTAYRYNKYIRDVEAPTDYKEAPNRWKASKVTINSDTLDNLSGYARGLLQTTIGTEQWLLVTKDQIYWGGGLVEMEGVRPLNIGFIGNMQPAAALDEFLNWIGATKLPLLVSYAAGAHLSPWFYGLTDNRGRTKSGFYNGKTLLKGYNTGFWLAASGRDKHEPDLTAGSTPITGGALAAGEIYQFVYYGSVSYGASGIGYTVETPQYMVPNILRAYVTPSDYGFPYARQGAMFDISAPELDAVNTYPVSGRYMLCDSATKQTVSSLPTPLYSTLVRTGPIPPVV